MIRPAALELLAIGSDGGGLRHAEREARAVAALWPAGAVVLAGAPAAAGGPWPADLGAFGVVHVATHALVHQGLPGRSTLRLARPGGSLPLTLEEVRGLGLRAELVFLSCCEADRRLSAGGDGVDSFARAFLAGGARSVVASSLRIDDEAAAALAEAFYRHWLAGKGRAASLQAAQLEVRGLPGSTWRHPHFWAGYRLIGDGS